MADLADTNALIRSGRDYYRFETFPGFWDWLAAAIRDGTVVLLPEVLGELKPRSTAFKDWLSVHGKASHPPATTMPIQDAYAEINRSLNVPIFAPSSVLKFKEGADYHLVAWALAGNHRVVTLEEKASATKRPRAVKIPDICHDFDIPCINPFQMLSDHGARFIQSP